MADSAILVGCGGIHGAIAAYLREQPGMAVRTATLDEPADGLPPRCWRTPTC